MNTGTTPVAFLDRFRFYRFSSPVDFTFRGRIYGFRISSMIVIID